MKVMVVGSGGREHAIAWKLAQDESVSRVVCCPGNAGIAKTAKCLPVRVNDTAGLLAAASEEGCDLVVFGPEEPLVNGAADALRKAGLTVFGPSQSASRLEGSKVFAKVFMKRHGIPSADFEVFDDYEKARAYVEEKRGPLVIKADGLAKGKGVVVCDDAESGSVALKGMMVDRRFGDSGNRVVVEERLEGPELSVTAVCDGRRHLLLPFSQDHKRALEGDRGPNTGGMGAYCPVPFVGRGLAEEIESAVVRPALEGMASDGTPYTGVLYAGIMLTPAGIRVLEFNCRFGDPETQAVLPSADVRLGETLLAAARGELSGVNRAESGRHSACVVLASAGYPGEYETGLPITGLDSLSDEDGVLVFHAATREDGGRTVTAGGRVLGITGTGPSLEVALGRAYAAVRAVSFRGMHFRRDIGTRALGVAG
ncbi:MAG: phosphoribosylamine--glycine ligase [Candidatus Eisenbacteria bacterium]|nr:phosphoribosylamine--glycine ligase [Candidatus Eisenbacteria bacterium]